MPHAWNGIRTAAGFQIVQQRGERDLAFSHHHVIHHAGAQAFFRIARRMCASKDDLNARMSGLKPFGFLDRGRKLAGHAADPGDANAVLTNESDRHSPALRHQ